MAKSAVCGSMAYCFFAILALFDNMPTLNCYLIIIGTLLTAWVGRHCPDRLLSLLARLVLPGPVFDVVKTRGILAGARAGPDTCSMSPRVHASFHMPALHACARPAQCCRSSPGVKWPCLVPLHVKQARSCLTIGSRLSGQLPKSASTSQVRSCHGGV